MKKFNKVLSVVVASAMVMAMVKLRQYRQWFRCNRY